ncbi:hypothetical protein HanRHA438_Chr03g0114651 [Helianthus annuus]|nr:hypothetical protein HanHA300_Chr03g0086461 [Helianthus annuus]KAJ0600143.1 hypothetical protein HanIR_Chr03g0113201 [Helianthus annuus]KAJ0607548.1 hypothetical protein HanHA89_Chr03g0098021 [Helianthus annuus]KAJ0767609.1 hypothetical protein HanLR1_Chr03g0091351 [Helianthus annuus]KAJ0773435.1 hypothetical protein HanOQP8_Chr03g0099251 [Helianthus annuus]
MLYPNRFGMSTLSIWFAEPDQFGSPYLRNQEHRTDATRFAGPCRSGTLTIFDLVHHDPIRGSWLP